MARVTLKSEMTVDEFNQWMTQHYEGPLKIRIECEYCEWIGETKVTGPFDYPIRELRKAVEKA